MTELAGWGVPGFLPPAVARRMAHDDAREAIEARRSEAERERRTEERHARALDTYREMAEARGELVSAMALATGQVSGRSIGDILAAAAAAADRDDVITEARLRRDGHGEPARVHVEVGEPVIVAPASATGRAIFHRARRFRAVLEARRQLEAAERAAEQSRHDYGLVDGVTLHQRAEPVPESPALGFGPMNVPWSQVGQWLAQG